MNTLAQLRVLVQIAFRNLLASRVNLIIGGIVFFGTTLVVVGGALLDSVETAMSRSIIGSVAGHIQLYREDSKDGVALFGTMTGGEPDLRVIDDFARLKDVVEKLDNVEHVVPMGISGALITSGNTIDVTLERARALETAALEAKGGFLREAERQSVRAHMQQMVRVLQKDLLRMRELATADAVDPAEEEAVARAASESFWTSFDDAPLDRLEFLENRIAPLAADGDLLFIRYVGTDMSAFEESFNRMQVVDGERVPTGKRGLLLAKFFYEEQLKLRTARRMDKIKEALDQKGQKIATEPELQRFVTENKTQTREFLLQLDALKANLAVERLQKALDSRETELAKLLASFFDTNDENFHARYATFYAELAPLLELYRIRVGDTMTIKAFTRTGYVQSVNVKVYGTFEFAGLEKSALAGALNLMDIVSFRELYGHLTAEGRAEIAKLKTEAGITEVKREDAEDALFGEAAAPQIVAEATPGLIDTRAPTDPFERIAREERVERVYSQDEIDRGVVLNAAVLLKDPKRLEASIAAINEASRAQGLNIKAVSWQEASGLVGQFVQMAKAVLFFAVFIIFVVALVIINNAVMMATLQRTREIGTMRAIGAHRGFVLNLVLAETLVLGLVFGGGGVLLGSVLIAFLKAKGIPAGNDALYFFFSGPRLFPDLSVGNVVAAIVIVVLVSSLSTLYPAFLSTRVSPVRAMQADE